MSLFVSIDWAITVHRGHPFQRPGTRSLQETVHRSQEPTVWLIAAADTQLYAAKAAGRNQVKSVDQTQAQPHDLHDRTDPAKRQA